MRENGGGSDIESPFPREPISRGILLEGKYRIGDQIGRGGMGTVFRALDELLDREVAVKFLLPQFQADPSFSERFAQEARALASVRHNNVLEIFSFGTYGKTPFFVMEFIRGVTMAEILKAGAEKGRRILVPEALRVISQACSGLAAVHRADVVHRDIKPANLMVQASTRLITLMDFGLGQRCNPSDPKVDTWMPGGSPAYMAPELFLDRKLDHWEARLADVYSLGVTAYELFTGQLPVTAPNWVALMKAHATEEPKPPSSLRSELPKGLDDVILQCLSKEPSLRYQHCEEIQQALLPYIEEAQLSSTLGTPSPMPESTPRGRVPEAPPDDDSSPPARDSVAPSKDESAPPRRASEAASKAESVPPRRLSSIPPDRDGSESKSYRSHPRFHALKRSGVLVADPDSSFRARALQRAEEVIPGCSFKAARTNLSALELARKTPPAIMLAALNDSRLNGLELVAVMRGDERLRHVQIILTVERITAQDKTLLEKMGVLRTLLKVDDSDEIGSAIHAAARAKLSQ